MDGQLGNGTPQSRVQSPVDVLELADVTQIAAGGRHTCARTSAGQLYCWGSNEYGQLGVAGPQVQPRRILSTDDVTQVTAGGNHTCARKSDNSVWCWGYNHFGQLGDRSTSDRPTPMQVVGLSGIVQVAARGDYSCALDSNGAVWCWGAGVDPTTGLLTTPIGGTPPAGTDGGADGGQGGPGGTDGGADGGQGAARTPVPVMGVGGAVEIGLGTLHMCARLSDGRLTCWGSNLNQQLGRNTTNDEYQPPGLVPDVSGAVQLALGGLFTCTRTISAGVLCWGANYAGQLGGAEGVVSVPTAQSALASALEITAGNAHVCGRKLDGITCAGDMIYDETGDAAALTCR
jgi:hypothetical protein